MRSADRISSTPKQWAEQQRDVRRRALRAVLKEAAQLREAEPQPEWYRWLHERWGPYRRGLITREQFEAPL